jgi:hypothetical protein
VVATYRAVLDAALASPLREALRNVAGGGRAGRAPQ